MSVQRVRRAWDYLRRTGNMDTHLAEVKLVTDGQTIFRIASNDAELLDALREGQLAFFVAIDEITRTVKVYALSLAGVPISTPPGVNWSPGGSVPLSCAKT